MPYETTVLKKAMLYQHWQRAVIITLALAMLIDLARIH